MEEWNPVPVGDEMVMLWRPDGRVAMQWIDVESTSDVRVAAPWLLGVGAQDEPTAPRVHEGTAFEAGWDANPGSEKVYR